MPRTKVVVRAWLIVAALACACEMPDRPEETRDHKKASKAADPAPGPPWEGDDSAETETPAAPNDVPGPGPALTPAPAATPSPAPAAPPPSPAPTPAAAPSSPVAQPALPTPQPAQPPVVSATPVVVARGIQLRGSLNLQLGLGSLAQVRVRVSALLESGLLHEIASSQFDAGGAFQLELPVGLDLHLGLAEVFDGLGQRLGARLIAVSPRAPGAVLDLAAIDGQSSLVADVLLGALRCPEAASASDLGIALEASVFVDAQVHAAIERGRQLGAPHELAEAALAQASVAAARARSEVFAQAGVQLDTNLLAQSRINLLEQLASSGGVQRSDGTTAAGALDSALKGAGAIDTALRARAQVASSLAATGALLRALDSDSKLGAALFPIQQASARIEAETAQAAVRELLVAGRASQPAQTAAGEAGARLRDDVEKAVDVAGLKLARTTFAEAVCGRPSASGGLLGGVLAGTTGLVGGLLQGVLGTVAQLTTGLEETLTVDLAAVGRSASCSGAETGQGLDLAVAKLARTLSTFAEDVRKSAVGSKTGSARDDAEALAKVLATAQLALRAAR